MFEIFIFCSTLSVIFWVLFCEVICLIVQKNKRRESLLVGIYSKNLKADKVKICKKRLGLRSLFKLSVIWALGRSSCTESRVWQYNGFKGIVIRINGCERIVIWISNEFALLRNRLNSALVAKMRNMKIMEVFAPTVCIFCIFN